MACRGVAGKDQFATVARFEARRWACLNKAFLFKLYLRINLPRPVSMAYNQVSCMQASMPFSEAIASICMLFLLLSGTLAAPTME